MIDAGQIILAVDRSIAFGGAAAPGLGGFEKHPIIKGVLNRAGQFHAEPRDVAENITEYTIPLTIKNLEHAKEYAARQGWSYRVAISEDFRIVSAEESLPVKVEAPVVDESPVVVAAPVEAPVVRRGRPRRAYKDFAAEAQDGMQG